MIKHRVGNPDAGYLDALGRLLKRVEALVAGVDAARLPLQIVIAGGTALFLHTGTRTSHDLDASLSLRVHLPDDLEEVYEDRQGEPASIYLDTNYNDTLGPLHENAHADAQPIVIAGIDRRKLDVRVLAPIDLAISKLGRFSDRDRDDIVDLAKAGLIDADALAERGAEALGYYVGNVAAPRASLRAAVKLVREHAPRPQPPRRRQMR